MTKTMRFALETPDDDEFKWLFGQARIASAIRAKMKREIRLPSPFDLAPKVKDGKVKTAAIEGIASEVASAYKDPSFSSQTVPYRTRLLEIEKSNGDFWLIVPDIRKESHDKHRFRIQISKKHAEARRELLASYVDAEVAKKVRSLVGRPVKGVETQKAFNEITGRLVFRRRRGWEFHVSYEPITPPPAYEPVSVLGVDVGIRKPIVAVVRKDGKSLKTIIINRQDIHRSRRYRDELYRRFAQKVIIPAAMKFKSVIAIEDLNAAEMVARTSGLPSQERKFHRLLNATALRTLQKMIREAAQAKGVPIIEVDPRGTSQCCPRCNPDLDVSLDKGKFYPDDANGHPERVKCPNCGYENDADWIGAWNIAGRAIKTLQSSTAAGEGMLSPVNRGPLSAPRENESTIVTTVEALGMTQPVASDATGVPVSNETGINKAEAKQEVDQKK
ncbi:MAG: transposase [Nitrososphaerota archaeon]|nr:transposase [Nitrososphaerota archaeon]